MATLLILEPVFEADFLDCSYGCRSPRSEPIRAIQEIRFKDRLQDQQGRHLHYPVAYRRDSQRPQFPIRLRYVDASYGLRPVGLGAQRFPQLLQEPFHSPLRRLDLLDRDAVDPRRSLIASHLVPGRRQHIAPIDQIVQRVESELRLLLGLLAQLLSQNREFLRQHTLRAPFPPSRWWWHTHHQPPDRRRALQRPRLPRSRFLLQSALPPSYKSMLTPRPLRSTGITPLLRYYGPLRLPAKAVCPGYLFPGPRGFSCSPALSGLPGPFTDLSLRAAPIHPGKPSGCFYPLLHRWYQASPSLAG